MNEIESIKFGIGTITSISHATLLQNSEISSEISAHVMSLVLHCLYGILVVTVFVLSVLNAKSSLNPVDDCMILLVCCTWSWSMTGNMALHNFIVWLSLS